MFAIVPLEGAVLPTIFFFTERYQLGSQSCSLFEWLNYKPNLAIMNYLKNNNEPKPKFFLMARKSTESEDRQVQSIDDQIKIMKRLAADLGIEIVKVFIESKSAKMPYGRPVFEEMMKRIEKGEAQGILCWKLDRLSRNPIDSARLQWALQQGIIKSIQTAEKEYRPEDNAILFSLESSMANQFIRDLKINVSRGMEGKRQRGWFPSRAPMGYLNHRIEKDNATIIKDPERFDIIRKCWDLFLSGSYTISQILQKLNNEWGFRTRKTKKTGGKPVVKSTLYAIFTNPFYTGIYFCHGQQYQGKHEPMVSFDEYDHVQKLLKKRGNPRPKTKVLPFRGFIRCGECHCAITGDTKTKFVKATNRMESYTYYACTRKKVGVDCSQRKAVKKEALELKIEKDLEELAILPEFLHKAIEILNEENDQEIATRSKIYQTQHVSLEETQKQIDRLTQMRYRDQINDEEFDKQRQELQKQLANLKQQTSQTEARAEHWLELTEKVFKLATYGRSNFIEGDAQKQKEITMSLGTNFELKDGILSYTLRKWLGRIKNNYPAIEKKYLTSEPKNRALESTTSEVSNLWWT